jgi:hypothetical protein
MCWDIPKTRVAFREPKVRVGFGNDFGKNGEKPVFPFKSRAAFPTLPLRAVWEWFYFQEDL